MIRRSRVIALDRPRRMNLGPILGGLSLVKNSMQDVGVDDMRSCDDDMVAWFRRRRCDEASGVSVVGPEDPFRVLRNDFHDEVRTGLIRACLQGVGGLQ